MDLTISIVNYNNRSLLQRCLQSVFEQTQDISFEVIVVDNASKDDSLQMVERDFPQVQIIRNSENLFFTKGHNKALRVAKGRYAVILNPDLFFKENVFKKMVDWLDAHSDFGCIGPRILDEHGHPQGSGDRLPSLVYGFLEVFLIHTIWKTNPSRVWRIRPEWNRDTSEAVESVSGACMMVRTALFKTVGILDEGLLIYWEETDWGKRILEAGYKIFYLHTAELYHVGSAGMDLHGRWRKEQIFYNSMLYYYRKHFGFAAYLLLKIIRFGFMLPVLKIVRKVKELV